VVSCYRCMGVLPSQCVCKKTATRRIDDYVSILRREMELLKRVTRGFRPVVRVRFYRDGGLVVEHAYKCRTRKIHEYLYAISLADVPCREGADGYEIVLLDAGGKPLYRRRYSIKLRPSETVGVNWLLGFAEASGRLVDFDFIEHRRPEVPVDIGGGA